MFISWKIFEILLKIDKLNIKEEILVKDLATRLNLSRTNPYFNQIRKLMLENKISKEEEIYDLKVKKIIINYKNLCKFIENTENWNLFSNYVHDNKLVYADI